jgi:hypothetical protein
MSRKEAAAPPIPSGGGRGGALPSFGRWRRAARQRAGAPQQIGVQLPPASPPRVASGSEYSPSDTPSSGSGGRPGGRQPRKNRPAIAFPPVRGEDTMGKGPQPSLPGVGGGAELVVSATATWSLGYKGLALRTARMLPLLFIKRSSQNFVARLATVYQWAVSSRRALKLAQICRFSLINISLIIVKITKW